MSIFQVAIDGPTASGKGTVARMLARKFGFLCLDTGALYRGITVYFLDNGVDHNDYVEFNRALGHVDLKVECIEGSTFVSLNGQDITSRIRDNDVSLFVPQIAKLVAVRSKVRQIQAEIATRSTLVCEGRDITSVVFPDARFKFYLTASVKERARRRFKDLQSKGEPVEIGALEAQIEARDRADMTRDQSPLVCVRGAVRIDATKISAYKVVKKMERIISRALLKGTHEEAR